jgi:quercetin dioxygenase-like cupin family protein
VITSKQFAAAALACAATGMAGTPAAASPPSGVAIENFVKGTLMGSDQENSDGVKFQTKADTAVLVQKLTFSPGGYAGWHHHPGIVIVTVASGTVRMIHSDCTTHDYGPNSPHGSVFVEGEGRVHNASASGGAVVYATYVAPNPSAPVFRVEDNAPFCATTLDGLAKKP